MRYFGQAKQAAVLKNGVSGHYPTSVGMGIQDLGRRIFPRALVCRQCAWPAGRHGMPGRLTGARGKILQ